MKRTFSIIGLVLAVVVLGGYAVITYAQRSGISSKEIAAVDNGIDPVSFKEFNYDATQGRKLKVHSIHCPDMYFAILVFASGDDYRTNPGLAKVNRAYLCNKNNSQVTLDLSLYNLASGRYYYFVADQGAVGSWYNPR